MNTFHPIRNKISNKSADTPTASRISNGIQEKVYSVVKKIPQGKVLTYADVACIVKNSKAVRAVGNILSKNNSLEIPCHRVVRSGGVIGKYNGLRGGDKTGLLKSEGVIILGGRVDLSRSQWKPKQS